jgi:hypothetical protein
MRVALNTSAAVRFIGIGRDESEIGKSVPQPKFPVSPVLGTRGYFNCAVRHRRFVQRSLRFEQ